MTGPVPAARKPPDHKPEPCCQRSQWSARCVCGRWLNRVESPIWKPEAERTPAYWRHAPAAEPHPAHAKGHPAEWRRD